MYNLNMYKKIFLIILLTLGFVLVKWFLMDQSVNYTGVKPDILPTSTPVPMPIVNTDVGNFAYFIQTEISGMDLLLFNNTQTKSDSKQLMIDLNCTAGINGGFYGTNDQPLGWMLIDNKEVSRVKSSELLNGFIWITDTRVTISQKTNDLSKYGLQTGPILITEGETWKLKMARDEKARRMVMGTADQKAFILAVFDRYADLDGPYLADLPEIVQIIANKEGLVVDNAINLDGGSASAIYTDLGNLEEISNVGSWWCVR